MINITEFYSNYAKRSQQVLKKYFVPVFLHFPTPWHFPETKSLADPLPSFGSQVSGVRTRPV